MAIAMSPQKVLVVDDEDHILELARLYLSREGYQIETVADGAQALARFGQTKPDLVVLDIMLPNVDGLTICREIRKSSQVPIIMLTARGQEQDKVNGLEAGADDYVTKPFSPKELLARIKAVLRRRAPELTDEPIEISGLRLDPATHRVTGRGAQVELGPTEFRLLHFLMAHPERVHSRAHVLDQVWGDHVFVEERTVDVHIRRLRKALEPTGHDRLIETVRGSGYRLAAN